MAFEELEEILPERVDLLVATGYRRVNTVRQGISEQCRGLGYSLVSYVSSKAMMMSDHPGGGEHLRIRGERDPAVRHDR